MVRRLGSYACCIARYRHPRQLSIGEIVAALPSGKVNPERVTLLLEVMQSRKAVVAVEDSGADRRWALPETRRS